MKLIKIELFLNGRHQRASIHSQRIKVVCKGSRPLERGQDAACDFSKSAFLPDIPIRHVSLS